MSASAAMIPPSPKQLYLVDGVERNCLPLDDRGLAYGDGLFETMRYRNRTLPLWPLHWQRLCRGAQVLGLQLAEAQVQEQLQQALGLTLEHALTDAVIKLIVTRGQGGQGYVPAADAGVRLIFIIKPYSAMKMLNRIGVELKTCAYRLSHNSVLAGIKHLNRLEQILAANSVQLSAGQQGLVLDRDERPVETLHHNLFLVHQTMLTTPALERCGVAGTLRQAIFETFAPALDLVCRVTDVSSDEVETADEVFICNAVHGITPVMAWHEYRWRPGPVTQALQQQIAQQWNGFYDG